MAIRVYFRCYLTGARFTIITDHRPLKYLLTIKEPSSRLAKWAMSLTEFDFEVQYRPGKQHHVDGFTRIEYPQEEMSIQAIQQDCTPIIYNLEEIKKAQSEDKDIQSLLLQEGYYQSPNGLCYKERLKNPSIVP
ncbi:Retrovirus-related Pol polyprotein from transposon 17.6-like Protein [Tribolium castaneum]|uniref:Retrovirus-related Pol polyprotein from transposon 17.6-like Protein n=1 Tax=Tribolium castaneum TaxID=7070 RepID=A0A139W934_TRICA|nr:Retrovirus-related Pol polyprotein from transposon 17.6-like Protein [Tribolium castaneum]